jgi:hypothetical protein
MYNEEKLEDLMIFDMEINWYLDKVFSIHEELKEVKKEGSRKLIEE